MNRLNGGFYAYKRGIMSNNRVEVHVGAKTSEQKGMDDAEKIVSDSAKQIENTTKGVRFKFDLSGLG